jgi:hypothetical protein
LQLKRSGSAVPAPDPTAVGRLQTTLAAHFTRLVTNIAILVYNSPVLQTIHADRLARNQRHKQQQNKSTAFSPTAVITPGELSLALLLQMLARAYYDEDCCDCAIELWSANAWLAELLNQQSDIVVQLLAERKKSTRYKKHAALYDRERIEKTVICVKECLSHYQGHAAWTRHFIMTHC